ncbi:hypothetical protein YC2023_052596 [Brassica napus]
MGSGALVLGCNTRTSREVTHPSTTLAQARLTAELMALRKHQKQPENPIWDPFLRPLSFCSPFEVPYLSAARLRVKTAEFGPEKLPPLFTALYGFWAFPKWCYGRRSSSRFKSYEGCNTRTSREVTHPSTTLAQARLTAEF